MTLGAAEKPSGPARQLPYFDMLLSSIGRGEADTAIAFGRHVHWGYWPDPRQATGQAADFAAAAERLTTELCDEAGLRDHQSVLDVGCGFGGTIASLNERFDGLRLAGLNIDARQLARARETIVARGGNRIEFVEGGASRLPFSDASFDAVLAVEAIFHFPDRAAFFAEARRVLKPGGRLVLSDFVPMDWAASMFRINLAASFYGDCDVSCGLSRYRSLAADHGFRAVVERDITANTLPTYAFLMTLAPVAGRYRTAAAIGTSILRLCSWSRLLRYRVLAFEAI